MISPKPGSPAFTILAFLARNPGSTAEEIAGALRAAYQPTGEGWRVELAQLRARVLASRADVGRLLGQLTTAGLVLPVQPYRIAPWWIEKYGTIQAGLLRTWTEDLEDEEAPNEWGAEMVAHALLLKVQKGPGSAAEILGRHPSGHTKEVWSRLQELGIVEGGRQREISPAGLLLVERP